MRAAAATALAMLLFAATPVRAAEAAAGGTLLINVMTLLDDGTDRTVLVPQAVAGALKKKYAVVLLFDAEGVGSLKMGRWFGGHSTPIDRVKIAPAERQHLAGLLGTTADGIPDIYGSLLHFFKGRGVVVYVNKRALALRGIDNDHFDHVAEAVEDERIVELLASAQVYAAY